MTQSRSVVVKPGERARATCADEQVFLAFSTQVGPCDPRTELAERIGEQRLARVIVEVGLDMAMASELFRNILKERRGTRCGVRGGNGAFTDLIQTIGSRAVDDRVPAVPPVDLDAHL